MTQITLGGCEPRTLLSHLALYGLGAILEAAGDDVRLGWSGSGNPRPSAFATEVDEVGAAARVGDHARALSVEGSWTMRNATLKGTSRGLMSPRLTPFGQDHEVWERVQRSRRIVLDELTVGQRWLDLRLIAALGEPCYWSFNKKRDPLQDDGVSRFEMQPRNQGSEFVGSRLRKLANSVALRQPPEILAGLRGESVVDEIGNDKPDSRTSTGLAGLGPTDNALAWCALWGISQFPIAMRINQTAETSGHLSHRRDEWFYVPMWRGQWRPARLRTILASQPLRVFADPQLRASADVRLPAAQAWLSSRGVDGVIRFPVQRFGSDNAPERRAMRGEPLSVRAMA
ncbi:MAG: hypothetical protein ACRDNS_16190 [Trebonia sp.]